MNLYKQDHPRLLVFPFAVVMNHGVQTICQCSIYMDVIREFRVKRRKQTVDEALTGMR